MAEACVSQTSATLMLPTHLQYHATASPIARNTAAPTFGGSVMKPKAENVSYSSFSSTSASSPPMNRLAPTFVFFLS